MASRRDIRCSLLATPSKQDRGDRVALLRAFSQARGRVRVDSAPVGPLLPLSNPWPGKRSLIGPREWVDDQDVSSRALKKARYELPTYADEACDVDQVRHQRLLSDLRMAHELYLRARRPDNLPPEHTFGAAVDVAMEYLREGRADLLEQAVVGSRERSPRFAAEAALLALHELDPARSHALARRLATIFKSGYRISEDYLRWTAYLVLADDPSAGKLLFESASSSGARGMEAFGALFLRSELGPEELLDVYLSSSVVDDIYFTRALRSLSVFPGDFQARTVVSEQILAGYRDPPAALMSRCPEVAPTREAAEALISKDSEDPRYRGPAEWARLLAACPPSEDNAVALFDGGDRTHVGASEVQALPRERLLKLLAEVSRGAVDLDMESLALCVSRVSAAEVFEIFSMRLWSSRDLQQLMLGHHLPAGPSWAWGVHSARPPVLRWDPRWLEEGLEEGYPLVVAGMLKGRDRRVVRWLMRAVGPNREERALRSERSLCVDREWILRKFSELNLPERLDLLLLTLKECGGGRRAILDILRWARPWSDGPALLRLLEELKRESSEEIVDADLLEEILEASFFRPRPDRGLLECAGLPVER